MTEKGPPPIACRVRWLVAKAEKHPPTPYVRSADWLATVSIRSDPGIYRSPKLWTRANANAKAPRHSPAGNLARTPLPELLFIIPVARHCPAGGRPSNRAMSSPLKSGFMFLLTPPPPLNTQKAAMLMLPLLPRLSVSKQGADWPRPAVTSRCRPIRSHIQCRVAWDVVDVIRSQE